MERDQELTPLSIDGAWYAVDIVPGGLSLPDGTHYIPGRAVSQDAAVPEGLVAYDVPGGLYASFGVHGMYQKALDSVEAWIRAEGYQRDLSRPGIEHYVPGSEGDFSVLLPVKMKNSSGLVRINYDGEPGFSVEVPEYFTAVEKGTTGEVFGMVGRPAEELPDLMVGVQKAEEGATLEEAPAHYVAFLEREYPSYTGHRVIDQKMIEMNDGTRAIKYHVLWLYSDGTTEFTTAVITMFKSGKRITVRSTDHVSPVAVMDRLVDSFRLHNREAGVGEQKYPTREAMAMKQVGERVRLIELPAARMARSGGSNLGEFLKWWSSLDEFPDNSLFPRDFIWHNRKLKNGEEWIYAIPAGLGDTGGYGVFDFPGGLYAVATCRNEMADRMATFTMIRDWIRGSGRFEESSDDNDSTERYPMVTVIQTQYAGKALGYDQEDLFVPVVLKRGGSVPDTAH